MRYVTDVAEAQALEAMSDPDACFVTLWLPYGTSTKAVEAMLEQQVARCLRENGGRCGAVLALDHILAFVARLPSPQYRRSGLAIMAGMVEGQVCGYVYAPPRPLSRFLFSMGRGFQVPGENMAIG